MGLGFLDLVVGVQAVHGLGSAGLGFRLLRIWRCTIPSLEEQYPRAACEGHPVQASP